MPIPLLLSFVLVSVEVCSATASEGDTAGDCAKAVLTRAMSVSAIQRLGIVDTRIFSQSDLFPCVFTDRIPLLRYTPLTSDQARDLLIQDMPDWLTDRSPNVTGLPFRYLDIASGNNRVVTSSCILLPSCSTLFSASFNFSIELIETFHESTFRRLMRVKARKWEPMK